MPDSIAEVVLDLAIDKPLDYRIPDELLGLVVPGVRVQVPLRGFLRRATVIEVKPSSSFPKLLAIDSLIQEDPPLTPDLLKLALWMAKYYCSPLGQVIQTILPAPIRQGMEAKQQLFVSRLKTREELRELTITLREKGSPQADILDELLKVKKGIFLTELLERSNCSRAPVDTLVRHGHIKLEPVVVDRVHSMEVDYFQTQPRPLSPEQQVAFNPISKAIISKTFSTHLLFGVTGSGKTEIYLQAIQLVLDQGTKALFLVPEISLTPQMIDRLRGRFREKIGILHYRLSDGEKRDLWDGALKGEISVILGARSAVFAPLHPLGLIIVDEEHEDSYKQCDHSPLYHARNTAIMRGAIQGCTVILGSATPSFESYYNASTGKYHLHTLTQRPTNLPLPPITLVDMRHEKEKSNSIIFSRQLLEGIGKRIERGEQTILFLNRRGYHSSMVCSSCGEAITCHQCDTTLTFHLSQECLSCHLCGYILTPLPQRCPKCTEGTPMKFKGYGTELVEKAIRAIFPDARTIRIDADTTKHKGSHEALLRDFRTGKADILIGTQMIAKGLHYPSVTLVGVLNCDGSLQIPDFRAAETTFQLITQVAGRAGRGLLSGEVILQTFMPDNATLLLAKEQNFLAFYHSNLPMRQLLSLPPFAQLIKILFTGKDPQELISYAQKLRETIARYAPPEAQLYPPIPAGHALVKGLHRINMLLKTPKGLSLIAALRQALTELPPPSSIHTKIDVDPVSTFF
jgi:primosomal protein N' (replication factor Y)